MRAVPAARRVAPAPPAFCGHLSSFDMDWPGSFTLHFVLGPRTCLLLSPFDSALSPAFIPALPLKTSPPNRAPAPSSIACKARACAPPKSANVNCASPTPRSSSAIPPRNNPCGYSNSQTTSPAPKSAPPCALPDLPSSRRDPPELHGTHRALTFSIGTRTSRLLCFGTPACFCWLRASDPVLAFKSCPMPPISLASA